MKASEYFHVKILVEDIEAMEAAGKHSPAVIAMEPHDVLPLSIFALNDVLKGVPGFKCLGCITAICFQIPLMKHIYTWVNAVSADKKTMTKMLKDGISPVICPGGVQEVTMLTSDDEIVLYLNSRFGFVKLALQHGAPIIPLFSFGLRDSFSFWVPKSKLLHSIGRKMGVLPMAFFGVWGLPLAPAKPCDYTLVLGRPIIVPKIENPTEQDLKHYHGEYVKNLTRIFELHKKDLGLENVKLRIE